MNGLPWSYGPVEFTIDGARNNMVELRVPHRGVIRSIILEQIGGADDGVFEIFDSEEAARALDDVVVSQSSSSLSLTSSSSVQVVGTDPAVHSITQGQVAINSGRYAANGLDLIYRNRDGNYSNPVRRLWLVINSEGSGQKTFSLSMMFETPLL